MRWAVSRIAVTRKPERASSEPGRPRAAYSLNYFRSQPVRIGPGADVGSKELGPRRSEDPTADASRARGDRSLFGPPCIFCTIWSRLHIWRSLCRTTSKYQQIPMPTGSICVNGLSCVTSLHTSPKSSPHAGSRSLHQGRACAGAVTIIHRGQPLRAQLTRRSPPIRRPCCFSTRAATPPARCRSGSCP